MNTNQPNHGTQPITNGGNGRPPFAGVTGTLDRFAELGIFKRGLDLSTLISVAGALRDGVECLPTTLDAIEAAARRTEKHPNARIASRSRALLEQIAHRRNEAVANPTGGARQ